MTIVLYLALGINLNGNPQFSLKDKSKKKYLDPNTDVLSWGFPVTNYFTQNIN